jgi:hypothetical protein
MSTPDNNSCSAPATSAAGNSLPGSALSIYRLSQRVQYETRGAISCCEIRQHNEGLIVMAFCPATHEHQAQGVCARETGAAYHSVMQINTLQTGPGKHCRWYVRIDSNLAVFTHRNKWPEACPMSRRAKHVYAAGLKLRPQPPSPENMQVGYMQC